jgi:hypothetical protein
MLLDQYYLSSLAVTRENRSVGDLNVYGGQRVSAPRSISYFVQPHFLLMEVMEQELQQ